MIDLLIAAGANTDCVSKTGSTPLHVACRSGNIDAATALVEWWVDIGSYRPKYVINIDTYSSIQERFRKSRFYH